MIGQTLSHYRILRPLGAGGMGEVYLAEDDRLGRKLALKILPEEFMRDASRVRRFEQEARAASALNHPNIITIYEIGHEGEIHFIATEFIEGETLRERMASRGLSLGEALEIAIQAAGALQAAHAAGIAHRDIKPDNIMLRPDGYIKVLDFGLAKLTEQGAANTNDLETPTRSLLQTQPGIVMGTVAYMSPEQARGQAIDGRTDIFSLGVVLYEMVAGERPFGGDTTGDMIAALLVSAPKRLGDARPNAPRELEPILEKMLAKDRDSRYQSAQEVIAALKRLKARVELIDDDVSTAMFEAPPTPADQAVTADYATRIGPAAAAQTSYETNVISAAGATANVTAAVVQATRPRRLLVPALIALLLLTAGAIVAFRYLSTDAKIDSIAVLPFINANNDPEADYLSEGVTEGLINMLSEWPDLSVSARNSVIRYKGKEADARAVGTELNVEAVLVGRIQRRGDELTINAELVDARSGRQIWGERLIKKTSDLIAIEDEIARKIAGKLQLRLSEEAQKSLAASRTTNPEAYDLYLKGRYYWNKGTTEDLHKADEYFEAAFGKDPSYALAAAGCAACHVAGSDREPPAKSMAKAKLVAEIALKKNDKIADPHLTLAQVHTRFDWNFAAAETEFKRAIELEPRNAQALHRYAEFLSLMGREKEATAQLRLARQLDPRSLPINQAFGTVAYYSKDYRDATRHLRDTLLLDDAFAPAHTGLGLVLEQQGQTRDAILEFLRAQRLSNEDPARLSRLEKAFQEQGEKAFWREYLVQLTAEAKDRYIPASAIAAVQLRLGEHDLAFQSLERAFEEKDGGLVELKVEPVFDPLRAQSRFHALLRRIGFSQ
ncbi:MAG: protein kinase [Blastocatellia bacterium]|nr:protein kinase [Blastocatellia bacterium]